MTTRREASHRLPIGQAIKEVREITGLSQAKLEQRAHRGGGYICMIELGKLNPTIEMVDQIATALGIEAWDLVQRACELRRRAA